MDLTYTDEQLDLRRAAADYLRDAVPAERVASIADGYETRDAGIWQELADLGWLGISAPEELGGVGLGLTEETIVLEEAGAALLPAPLLATVGLALPILCEARADSLTRAIALGELRATLAWAEPDLQPALSEATAVSTRAVESGGQYSINGLKAFVPDGEDADLLIVVAATIRGTALFAVKADAPGVAVRRMPVMDSVHGVAEVLFEDAPAELLVASNDSQQALDRVWRRAITLASAEAVGLTRAVLELTTDYASVRKQFGRVIGTYQAVSHQIANVYTDLELSRSLVMWTALTVENAAADADLAVAATAAKVLPAAVTACERAIQIHGGIGTTWESPLHRYYKRSIALLALDGPSSRHRARVAELLAASG